MTSDGSDEEEDGSNEEDKQRGGGSNEAEGATRRRDRPRMEEGWRGSDRDGIGPWHIYGGGMEGE